MRITFIIGLFLTLTFLFNCCTVKKENIVSLSIIDSSMFENEIKINTFNMISLMPTQLAQTKTDNTGKANLKFKIDRPTFGALGLGSKFYPIYIEPDYTLSIRSNENGIIFSGVGANENNYLNFVTKLVDKLESNNAENIYELNEDLFLERINDLEGKLIYHLNKFSDSLSFPNPVKRLFDEHRAVLILKMKEKYVLYYNKATRRIDILNEVSFDTTFLSAGLIDYAFVLHNFLEINGLSPHNQNIIIDKQAARKTQFKIQNSNYNNEFKEFMFAKNITESLMFGKPKSLDSVFNDFQEDYPNSKYLPTVSENYFKWVSISEGKSVPEIIGMKSDSALISIKDLKGKVIYIDVWATWCRPCIEEFPNSIKLQEKFKSSKNLIFLYFSIDQDFNLWNRYLVENPKLKGLHLIETKNQIGSIQQKFIINTIPRYILINSSGEIINADAPRPSSDEIVREIEKALLQQNSISK